MPNASRPATMLVALTGDEWRKFLPGALGAELRQVAANTVEIDPTGFEAAGWTATLAAHNPDILVAAWNTPMLPPEPPPGLRYVCYVAGSVRTVVTRTHIERGLLVTNWGGSISRTIAECALLHILAGLRRLTHWTLAMHTGGAWKGTDDVNASLFGRTVGIRGFGRIARELLKLLAPFGCKIAVHAPDIDATAAAASGVAIARTLDSLFSENDIVVELAPLTGATRRTITEAHLRRLRPGGVFVNVGRGATVDEEALLRVAAEGRIMVGLDVFGNEPLPADSGFRRLPNVSLTPHMAGPTTERFRDAGEFALANLKAFAAGGPLQAVITPEIYDFST